MTRRPSPNGSRAAGAGTFRGRGAAVALVLAAACFPARTPPRPAPPDAPAERAWATALAAGRGALAERAFARADSVFSAVGQAFPGSGVAAEAAYWRALGQADPQNTAGDTAAAALALDAYRATDPPRAHFVEAGVLRALLARTDSLRLTLGYERSAAAAAAAGAAAARATMVPRDSLRARDEALDRMRAELAYARAELERVRRRLAAPPPRAAP